VFCNLQRQSETYPIMNRLVRYPAMFSFQDKFLVIITTLNGKQIRDTLGNAEDRNPTHQSFTGSLAKLIMNGVQTN
jgi:hypothetical protein